MAIKKDEITRRELGRELVTLASTAASAAVLSSGLGRLAFGSAPQVGPQGHEEVLVTIFLRGGCDGLNIVPPLSGEDREIYESSRPNLKLPMTGDKAVLKLDDRFGFHPSAKMLHGLFQSKKLAIVHAVGLTSDSRSHFDAQAFMELGTPGKKNTSEGWITRHLQNARIKHPSLFSAVAIGNLVPNSLLGYSQALAINGLGNFNIGAKKNLQTPEVSALREMYLATSGSWLGHYGIQTLDAMAQLDNIKPADYHPIDNEEYPKSDLSNRLKTLAQLIKMDLGLHVANIDMGGWDTHKFQGNGPEGHFANQVLQLSEALAAFYRDLSGKITIVVMSEFGRRVKENANHGTDHGHGNIMMILGESVNGGKVYGNWLGLRTEHLYDRADVAVTTDYRRVLGEIINRRQKNSQLAHVFPGYTGYKPLGIIT